MKPSTLRALYEASYDGGAKMDALDVSFDDYFAFMKMHGPLCSRRSIAETSRRPVFRSLAKGMPPDPPSIEPLEKNQVWLERKSKVTLGSAKIDPMCEQLYVHRVKTVSGWASLGRLASLETLKVSIADSNDATVARPKISLEEVDIDFTSLACVRSVLASVDATKVSFGDIPGAVDLRSLPLGRKITHFRAAAALIRGTSAISKCPIQDLCLGDVEIDDELRATLASLAPTLQRLFLTPTRLYDPKQLGNISEMRALRHVLVPSGAEYRDAWIDVAVAHPKIGFSFSAFAEPAGEVCSVESLHRGVDILRFARKSKKPSFEVAGDLASMRKGYRGSNEDLEDELRAEAKEAKKKIAWSGENDMLVARAADAETCRWVIDRTLDGAPSTRARRSRRT